MTLTRFRELWKFGDMTFDKDGPFVHFVVNGLREALTAFVESEAMRNSADHQLFFYECNVKECPHKKWTNADWLKATWERYLGKQP